MSRTHGRSALVLAATVTLAALLVPASANAALSRGSLTQLPGAKGCLVDSAQRSGRCGVARALKEPGPFMGSRAIQISPDGRNVYVASSKSNAIAIFKRDQRHGTLKQAPGSKGCAAARRSFGCARAIGLDGPNSIAISPDGGNVYATARDSSSVVTFRRNRGNGALTQLPAAAGCVAGVPIPACGTGRAMAGADVVTVSPDGRNVYVGAFFGNAVATFDRDPATGELTQPADETGCLTAAPEANCATGLALNSVEGMAVSGDGANVYVASATSNAVLNLVRDSTTGALSQAADGSGCFVDAALEGCMTGREISGANAVAVSPRGGDVYVTSLISGSVTQFSSSGSPGLLSQPTIKSGCVAWLGASGCTPGRSLRAPEGIAVSPDGTNVYAAAYSSGGIAVLERGPKTGGVVQKFGTGGCVTTQSIANCATGRAMDGLSSIAISRDGRFVYSTAAKSNAVNVFRRATRG
ncbi:MAG TPA: YncE family protein [Solirubrobacterales bacterium]|nr:YncE family protein [Solirubrobacterales bacterium]